MEATSPKDNTFAMAGAKKHYELYVTYTSSHREVASLTDIYVPAAIECRYRMTYYL